MPQTAWEYYKDFLGWNIEKQNKALFEKSPTFWEEIGAQKSLEVFHAAAEQVPAYKDFLRKRGIDHQIIKTIDDFKNVPPVDKKNYLRQYPLHKLCWDGDLKRMNVVSVSSGATGDPFFWPRDIWQEQEVDHLYELIFKYLFNADKKHSLVVIAFAMGMYIAGPFTFASLLRLAQKGYPISLTTPGYNVESVLRVVSQLNSNFDQIILGGYPPLVKEIIDLGEQKGIDWRKKQTKLFFGGEGFSEQWRKYVLEKIGSKDALDATVNMYGTADAALLGFETPASIRYRQTLTDLSRLQSVLSYNPLLKYFETDHDGHLLFTSSSGLPVIRYRIGDEGGVVPYNEIRNLIESENDFPNWKLPLVFLYGRKDLTVQLFGANIYPENIKLALEDTRVNSKVSGKFIMSMLYRRNMSPYLNIRVELSPRMRSIRPFVATITKIIVETLRRINSEYEVVYNALGEKTIPIVRLEPHGHKDFRIAIKHQWTAKKKS